ncbi:FAD-dependent monooxygenase [Micromonospora sp. NPDC049101]|uniref:FAD-dependent monooxygenase n=1 Tax=Micromonospora sp. NPDC049101 TaxID=3155032 RepID=UPI0033FA905F
MVSQVNPDVDVVVVGAGPTGLTLAIELARRRVRVRIIDRNPADFYPGTRGNGLQPRTLEVFHDLGVIDPILATGQEYPPVQVYFGRDPVYQGHTQPRSEPTPDVPYPMPIVQPQWRTERILRERLAGLGVAVEHDAEMVGFDQDDNGVTVSTAAGSSIRARFVVGADGGRSGVRKALGVGFTGTTRPAERLLLGDVTVPGMRRDVWQVWVDPERKQVQASIWPVAGTDYFRMSAPITADDTPDLTLAGFQRLLTERTRRRDLTVTTLTAATDYRVSMRLADRYRVGRVFLAGDAAHIHSPAGSQGLNTGVQDAYNLGWKLARVLAGAPDALLDTYEAERRPVAEQAIGLSTELLDDKEATPDERTFQLRLSYRDGPLAAGGRGGDRAPDAPCRTADGTSTSLFDVFRGTSPTLLCLERSGEVPEGMSDAVRAYRVGVDLLDPDDHVRAAYGDSGYVLVRPDGYIGVDTSSAGEVAAYLTAI